MRAIDEIRFHLDTPEPVAINAEEYALEGWFFVAGNSQPGDGLVVVVDGTPLPVHTGVSRPDVARHVGEPGVANCGFIARFKAPVFDARVTLMAQTGDGALVLANMAVEPPARPATGERPLVSSYSEWIAIREPALFWPANEITDRLSVLAYQPLISVVLPTYNTDLYFLERCVQSVRDQHYSHWQLCVVDDCSTDPHVVEYIASVARQDPRISLTVHAKNGGISAASNTALEKAKGEFVVLLDHDDELHPFALLEVARCLNRNESADLIYSDEDKIDRIGRRSQPAFKPDFDMDMFLSFDYLGHLVALRSSVVERIAGFRPECDGSQDWDLLIRAAEAIGLSKIDHIPKPLYHWRMHDDSTAFSLHSKPYVRKAWARVISEHIARTGKNASAEPGLFYGSTRVKYKRPKNISVAVLVKGDDGQLQAAALEANADRSSTKFYEVINCGICPIGAQSAAHDAGLLLSTQGRESAEYHDAHRSVRSLSEVPGDVFVFINRQVEVVNHSFFGELAAQAMRSECGLVTGISLDVEGRAIHSGLVRRDDGELIDPFVGVPLSQHGYMGQLSVVRKVEAVGDQFFAVRREHLAAVGGLGAVSGAHMPRLVHRLAQNARQRGLLILVTPYALATLEGETQAPPMEPLERHSCPGVSINPNLMAFRCLWTGCLKASL